MAVPTVPSCSVVWQCPTAAVHMDATGSVFIMEWLDYNSSAQFRVASEKFLSFVQASTAPAKVALIDTERLKIIGLQDQPWVREVYLPSLIAHGVRCIAMVNSLHYFTRVGVGEIMKDRSDVHTEYFSSRDEALAWAVRALEQEAKQRTEELAGEKERLPAVSMTSDV